MMSRKEALEYGSVTATTLASVGSISVGAPTDPRTPFEKAFSNLHNDLNLLQLEVADLTKRLNPVLAEYAEETKKTSETIASDIPAVRVIEAANRTVTDIRDNVKFISDRLGV